MPSPTVDARWHDALATDKTRKLHSALRLWAASAEEEREKDAPE